MIQILNEVMMIWKKNHVSDGLISILINQIFHFIDIKLFNELITRKELCRVSNGFQIKLELSALESWIKEHSSVLSRARATTTTTTTTTTSVYSKATKDELCHITQAATLLFVDKHSLGEKDVLLEICPSLSTLQVKVILESFSPDQYLFSPHSKLFID